MKMSTTFCSSYEGKFCAKPVKERNENKLANILISLYKSMVRLHGEYCKCVWVSPKHGVVGCPHSPKASICWVGELTASVGWERSEEHHSSFF